MATFSFNGRDVQPVEWHNERILLTKQLAEFYECSAQQIQQNFTNRRDRFVEGRHYFKLEGDDLRKFKRCFDFIEVATRVLYLWTKRGAARHAKMLNTDRAWDVFELLEGAYFDGAAREDIMPGAPFAFERGKMLMRLASHTRDPLLREKLVRQAANLIAGEVIVPEIEMVYNYEPQFIK